MNKFTSALVVALLSIVHIVGAQCTLYSGAYTQAEVKECLSGNKTLIIPDNQLVELDGSWDLTSLGPITLIIRGNGCIIFSGYNEYAEKLKLAEGSSITIEEGADNPFALIGTGSAGQVRIKIGDTRYKERDFEDLIGAFGVSAALPVELAYFRGKPADSGIRIEWNTAVEINNAYFEVEFSRDGKEFKSIAYLEGSGTSAIPNFYHFQHNTPVLGHNYYRLKQTDFDDTHTYSPIITISWKQQQKAVVNVFPNPIQERFTIDTADGSEPTAVHLFNALGQQIATHWPEGLRQYELPPALDRGHYILKIQIGSQQFIEHLLIQ